MARAAGLDPLLESLPPIEAALESHDPIKDTWRTAAAVRNMLYVIGGGRRPGLSVSGANEALKAR